MKKLGYIIGKLFLGKKRTLQVTGKKVSINDYQKIGNCLFKTSLINGKHFDIIDKITKKQNHMRENGIEILKVFILKAV